MLVLGSQLLNTPVMSLQTGARIAQLEAPVIDPSDLTIPAYQVKGPLLDENPSFLRVNDIREIARIGVIIDSSEELVGVDDVIKIQKLSDLGFGLIGMQVIDEHKRRLGKVENYSLETATFTIQKLHIKRGFLKGLSDTGLLIHRTQVVEINHSAIIVKAPTKKVIEPQAAEPMPALDYVNPFRKPSPQPEAQSSST